jgi:molybdenum cofactor guanylyltransferase
MRIEAVDITGLILAGGRGTRMGGSDKGLQPYMGVTLAQNALRRLAPQVGQVALNANRNIAVYEGMGVQVWQDPIPGYPGPLAGMLAGLRRATTPYLVTVACDAPNFPLDLVQRLVFGLEQHGGEIAIAVTQVDGAVRRQPVFSLMKTSLAQSATSFLNSGQSKVGQWASEQGCAEVLFEDANEFFNANTFAHLEQLKV